MNRLIFIFIFLLSGCGVNNVVHIDFENKLEKKINYLNKMNNEGYRCFYATGNNREYLKREVYHQIIGEINTFVNSNMQINQTQFNQQGSQLITQKIDTSSFGFINGVNINYEQYNNKILAYTCLNKYEFNNLKEENLKKTQQFFKLLNEYQIAIQKEDKTQIENIKFKINSEFPNVQNPLLDELNKKASQLVKVDYEVSPNYIQVGENVYVSVYSDKKLYAYFILKTPIKLFFLKKSVIVPNQKNEIKLNINQAGEIFVYFTKKPLDINRYLLSNNELDKKFKDYILDFKLSNYLKKGKINIEISNETDKKICVKSNKFLNLISNQLSIDNTINCEKYQYLIKIKVKEMNDGFIFKIYLNNDYFSLYKRFNKQDKNYLKNVVIPQVVDAINSHLN